MRFGRAREGDGVPGDFGRAVDEVVFEERRGEVHVFVRKSQEAGYGLLLCGLEAGD